MKKINFSKLGIDVAFTPVVDRQFNVIAYEAIMLYGDAILAQHFPSFSLDEVKQQLDVYYRAFAIESYKGLPLILSTSEWENPFPNSVPELRDFEMTISFKQVWLSFHYLGIINPYSKNKFRTTSREIGQGLQSLPLLLHKVQPRFNVLSEKFTCPHNRDEIVYAFSKVLQYLREMGIEFIAAGTSTKELLWFPKQTRLPTISNISGSSTDFLPLLSSHVLSGYQFS
jgi:hypothetical protein